MMSARWCVAAFAVLGATFGNAALAEGSGQGSAAVTPPRGFVDAGCVDLVPHFAGSGAVSYWSGRCPMPEDLAENE
jgi:hypothetical protein